MDYRLMADKMTAEQRHKCMSHIRSRDTKPEKTVRRHLFSEGFRYRLNVRYLPGSPDIVLAKYHTVIFVNGCFWHGHKDCRHYVIPKTNTAFWSDKIQRNIRRDSAVCIRLEALGLKVITVWECELEPSRRDDTLSCLVGKIKKNGDDWLKEQDSIRLVRESIRNERMESRRRRMRLQSEIDSLYKIPERIRKASENNTDE